MFINWHLLSDKLLIPGKQWYESILCREKKKLAKDRKDKGKWSHPACNSWSCLRVWWSGRGCRYKRELLWSLISFFINLLHQSLMKTERSMLPTGWICWQTFTIYKTFSLEYYKFILDGCTIINLNQVLFIFVISCSLWISDNLQA